MLGCHHGFRYVASPDPRSKLHSLVRLSGTIPRSRPASGRVSRAGLVQDAACGTGAQRRLVLDETEHGAMLVQVGPPASSKTATPNHVLPVIPGDRNELVECHSEATRGRSPVCPIGQQRSCCDDQLNPPITPPRRDVAGLCASLPTLPPRIAAKTAENPRLSWDGGEIRRETDCLLEGDGFELLVPRHKSRGFPQPDSRRSGAPRPPKNLRTFRVEHIFLFSVGGPVLAQ